MPISVLVLLGFISSGFCYPYLVVSLDQFQVQKRAPEGIFTLSPLIALSASGIIPQVSRTIRNRISRRLPKLSYQPFSTSVGISPAYPRTLLRASLPTDMDSEMDNGNRQLRFLNWLFGSSTYRRPYPDYSSLEAAAGLHHPSGHLYSSSPYIVEDCVEMIDPYTHEIYEDCEEVHPSVFH